MGTLLSTVRQTSEEEDIEGAVVVLETIELPGAFGTCAAPSQRESVPWLGRGGERRAGEELEGTGSVV